MPNEILAPNLLLGSAERHEIDIDAEKFCEAYRDVSNLQRLATAATLGVLPAHLTSGNLPNALDESAVPHFLSRLESILASPQMQNHIEQSIANGNYQPLLEDEEMRSYIVGLARIGFTGALIDGLVEAGKIPRHDKRAYRHILIEMNHSFKTLADSGFGRELGFGRSHLKDILGETYGANYDERSAQLRNKLEMGIAAEVATMRYIEQAGAGLGIEARYSTVEEDGKKIDIICRQGRKNLGIDVKSGDKNSGPGGEVRAWRTPIEEYDLNEYRVRELYPAKETSIGEKFDIKAKAYERVIDELLEEFSDLP